MTVREEAYGLIDRLPEDSVRAVIQIMRRMSPVQKKKEVREDAAAPKMKAYHELQEMRKEASKYAFSTDERASATDEKFGSFVWNGDVK